MSAKKNREICKRFLEVMNARDAKLVFAVGINEKGQVLLASDLGPDQIKEVLNGLLATI